MKRKKWIFCSSIHRIFNLQSFVNTFHFPFFFYIFFVSNFVLGKQQLFLFLSKSVCCMFYKRGPFIKRLHWFDLLYLFFFPFLELYPNATLTQLFSSFLPVSAQLTATSSPFLITIIFFRMHFFFIELPLSLCRTDCATSQKKSSTP